MSNPYGTFHVVFYEPNPGGAYDPAELRDLDIEAAITIPSVGDYVYDTRAGKLPIAYKVKSRHFDPAGGRVGVVIEQVDQVENSPFL
ncbi:hypothetical protein [Palleronia sp. LCG004]|uniref:hypothetical protein n=1 Tax=Palleronia sp. LCG004 TaxID=3079304 RepID=UPI0029420A28|nr:hypothetical protein [Palleronia sp. LCG004]WOI55120.1 hypothetical protein RVY76_08605 [Palleronia sp. LCG004]